ncbi:MAG: hypothetical protein QFF03_11375 [Pseudomonadota bacterium]|nr:hypothetical protein [Pseudomonadota bacterium]
MTRAARLGVSFIARTLRAAAQWRLLLLWTGCLLAPALLMALPVWRVLGASFDHSVHAAALAQELDLTALTDVVAALLRDTALPLAAALALMATLLLSPLLSGMAMGAARAQRPLGFGALIGAGLGEYPRMARMLLVAAIPLGVAAALGALAMAASGKYCATATLQGDAAAVRWAALALALLLLAGAQATLDAGRATLALDRRRRSALRAWWDGCKLVGRRPLATCGIYVAITLGGLALAALLAMVRLRMPAIGSAALAGGFLLTQLGVMVLGWMRVARLFAMVALAGPARP